MYAIYLVLLLLPLWLNMEVSNVDSLMYLKCAVRLTLSESTIGDGEKESMKILSSHSDRTDCFKPNPSFPCKYVRDKEERKWERRRLLQPKMRIVGFLSVRIALIDKNLVGIDGDGTPVPRTFHLLYYAAL
eukprot:TRINITY_DN112_c0_g1_i3.p1 TRINITY_DN112_c0_g1~~TRINITY_DN112_c0_g1_i3.p1  ORF type:complete len:131 (-),score=19.36 TRINITY_DN112_c0_g1_i3:703-1095(-)